MIINNVFFINDSASLCFSINFYLLILILLINLMLIGLLKSLKRNFNLTIQSKTTWILGIKKPAILSKITEKLGKYRILNLYF